MKPLIITPHMDDEVLGCASFLSHPQCEVRLLYLTYVHPAFPNGEMVKQNEKLLNWLEIPPSAVIHLDFPGNHLDHASQHRLITEIEGVINRVRPDTVLVPHPSFNQDHRAVYDAALAALRPHDANHAVKRVLIYEQPEVLGTLRVDFRATYFRPVDMDFKRKCLELYPQVMRGHRTLAHLEALARMRGYQVNIEFAEAFEVLRWMD